MTVFLAAVVLHAEILMPGTQPLEGDINFGKVDQCIMCHGNTSNGAADPVFSWQAGMMAQAARDPVFRAALAIANQDVPDVGEFCIRCHSPGGWLADRSKVADASALTREDLHGVSCEPCHHLVDPLSDEAKTLAAAIPPGYGNGMMVADPANVVRGPYEESPGARPHGVKRSDYLASSQLCATCHDVSNPLQAEDVMTQPPYAYGPIERTYSEWALSDFAQMGAEGTCQSCHYPQVAGGGQPSRFSDVRRDYFVQHGPVGGSTWVQDVTYELWDGRDMSRQALEAGKERARALLRAAATLTLAQVDANTLRLRVTNLTGHKLPTGYPEGRRMWVHAVFQDAQGRVIEERGRYAKTSDTLWGKSVEAPTLLDPELTRVYECVPGISAEQAKKHDVAEGPSLHFVLNDIMVKDNRIPPKGFTLAAFTQRRCEPIGADYEDGQHWD
ncbi:MAG: hypothetical protein IT445_13240 [Phycisphaeraceae bacterium]|nr:hypothetical protein [Phycisphaeraceae bacterium]